MKTVLKVLLVLGRGFLALPLQQLCPHRSPGLWDHSWTCSSSSWLLWTMPCLQVGRVNLSFQSPWETAESSLKNTLEMGTGSATGKLAGTEALERDRFSRVMEGNKEPEGKTSLPGGKDKAKLIRRSLEARLLGEDFEPEWEWEKLLGGRAA